MYDIVFYHDQNGHSEIEEYLEELRAKGENSKQERILHKKILEYLYRKKEG